MIYSGAGGNDEDRAEGYQPRGGAVNDDDEEAMEDDDAMLAGDDEDHEGNGSDEGEGEDLIENMEE